MLLGLKRISTAFGLLALVASVATAQAPAPAASQNQATANAVASALKSSRTLSAYRIEIEARDGVVTLTGSVPNATQKREALALVNKVARRHRRGRPDPRRRRPGPPGPVPDGHGRPRRPVPPRRGEAAPVDDGGPDGLAADRDGPGRQPGPRRPRRHGCPAGAGANQPNYAWPSYAPTGNFSAVGYPTAYPWQAWPNIGPFYPYPEVPQDWRAVTLRWDDGIWWLDFKKNYTRPFFTPYPFGLFAY